MPPNAKGRGVLPVTAAQTKKPIKPPQPQAPPPRLRLIIRRLPPGLLESEFWECIGAEWQIGKGKVDIATYKVGKVSKDLAKPSRPARAYLKVKDSSYVQQLSAHVRTANFQDTKNTTNDACLLGPPSLEFAPYNKTSNTRMRHDGRQGTIDQDAEFIDFLQSLTEPIARPASREAAEAKLQKPSITPLVQYIKDKKANKAKEKEAAAAKAALKQAEGTKDGKDVKDTKPTNPAQSTPLTKKERIAATEAEKARVAKATQDAVESIRKSVAEIKGRETSKPATKAAETPEKVIPQPSARLQRPRGDVSAAARIIGRDLGLTPKEGRGPRGQRAVTTPNTLGNNKAVDAATPPVPNVKFPDSSTPSAPAAASPLQPPTGPKSLRNAPIQATPQRIAPAQPPPKIRPLPQPAAGAKSAFLKHANPSQGVTEDLLREVFAVHGTITRCEIDKKKGLGYIDFTEPDALKKAMAVSPVKVGNGSVVVLENRTPYKKVSNVASRSNAASPIPTSNASTAPSPQKTHSVPVNVPEHSPQAQLTKQAPTSEPPSQSWADEMDEAANPAPSVAIHDIQKPSTPTTSVPPVAPRGGRGRGNFRGRTFRGGRGGQARGGNRAASTPTGSNAATGSVSADGGKT